MRNLFVRALLAGFLLHTAGSAQVSVYVSLDEPISKGVLDDFQAETGIQVLGQWDVEANKTIGMVNRIIAEKDRPRCDVYWNNEVAQTIRLKNLGLLEAYRSPSAQGIPEGFKDPDGFWTGFAARARVIIYNKELIGDETPPKGLMDLVDPRWKGRIAMAKPLTGTTLTHFAALFSVWGETRTQAFVERLLAAGIQWQAGNAMVMREVGRGAFVWGYTDTDDANVSRMKGHPTGIILPDQDEGEMGTLVIPNSVALIKGAPHAEAARKLIDYLLSPRVEERLASGRSAQIPLRPGLEPPAHLKGIRPMAVDWEDVGRQLETYAPWLKRRFDRARGGTVGEKSRWAIWVGLLAIAAVALIGFARRRGSE